MTTPKLRSSSHILMGEQVQSWGGGGRQRGREQRGEGGGSRVEKGGEGQRGWRDVQNEMYQDWSEKPLVLA